MKSIVENKIVPKRSLLQPWYGILLIAFFLPFERIGSFDIAGVTIRPSQLIACVTLVSLVFFFLSRGEKHIPKNPIIWSLISFFLIALLGLFHAPNVDRSLMVLFFQLCICAIAILIPFVLHTTEQLKQLLFWLLLGTAVVTVFGLFQFVGDWIGLSPEITGLRPLYTKSVLGFPRVQSTALEPLYFANYLLIPFGLLLALFFQPKRIFPLWAVSSLLGLVVLNILLTVARGAYIAAIPLVCIVATYSLRHVFQKRVLIAVGVCVSSMLIAITQFGAVSAVSGNVISHVKNLFGGASYIERADMFVVAIDAWHMHPLIGIGSGSFGPYQASSPYQSPREGWKIVNNEYLELLAENGVLGLIAMLSVFSIVLLRSIKAIQRSSDHLHRIVLVGLLAAFVGIVIQYNTFSILYIVHIWFVIGVLIAVQNMVLSPKRV